MAGKPYITCVKLVVRGPNVAREAKILSLSLLSFLKQWWLIPVHNG